MTEFSAANWDQNRIHSLPVGNNWLCGWWG